MGIDKSNPINHSKVIGHPKKNETAPVVCCSLVVQKKQKFRWKPWTIYNAAMGNILISDNFCGFGIKTCTGGHGTRETHYYCYHHIVTTDALTTIATTQGTTKHQYCNFCS